jgi:phosphoglucomutase
MTAFYKDKGSSLYDAMIDMYLKYGFYKEKLVSITKKGKTGAEEIVAMMERFRNNPPQVLGGSKVVSLKDYGLRKETDLLSGKVIEIDLPKSDVLQFITEDGCIISARPSGTEPKIKFYCSVNKPLVSKADFDKVNKELEEKVDQIMSDLAV